MQVVVVHTDLRAYWVPRLKALRKAMAVAGDELHVREIGGTGTPYSFIKVNEVREAWRILLPEGDLRQMPGRHMAGAVEQDLNKLRPDVVMAGGIAFPSGAAAVRWARINRRPVIIFDNVRPQDVPRSWVVEWVKRRFYSNVDAMLIPAESHRQGFVDWGVRRDRLFFGLNVVDNEHFSMRAEKTRRASERIRHERGLPDQFFLCVGRHIAIKNWKACIEAYADYRIRCEQRPWDLVLVGDGPEHKNLKEYVAAKGIRGVLLPGVVVGDELSELYGLAEALVMPSLGETWGLVVNEAMASRLPVLVSNQCGCYHTLVREGENGWSFPPHDVEALRNLMIALSSLPDAQRRDMGKCSSEIISHWGLEQFVHGAMEAIDSVKDVRRGFTTALDRLLISLWNGRYRPV